MYELFIAIFALGSGALIFRFVPATIASWWQRANKDLVGRSRSFWPGEEQSDSDVRHDETLLFHSGMRIGAAVAVVLFIALGYWASVLFGLLIN